MIVRLAWSSGTDCGPGAVPEHVYKLFSDANMLIPNLPAPLPVEWLRSVGIEKIGPVCRPSPSGSISGFCWIQTTCCSDHGASAKSDPL